MTTVAAVEAGLAALAGRCSVLPCSGPATCVAASRTGAPFFTSDLSLGPLSITAVLLGVPSGAILASIITLRRVRVSPLGVTRRVGRRPPRMVRLVPLAAGLALLGAAAFARNAHLGGGIHPFSGLNAVTLIAACFALIVVGLAVAGPYLTLVSARLLLRSARRDSTLIAGRRLADDPRRAFRAISGLILAVFVGTGSTGVVGTAIGHHAVALNGRRRIVENQLAAGTLLVRYDGQLSGGASVVGLPAQQTSAVLAAVRRVAGVRLVVPVYAAPCGAQSSANGQPSEIVGSTLGLMQSADLNRLAVFGKASSGSGVVVIPTDAVLADGEPPQQWHSIAPPGSLERRALQALIVCTDGSQGTIERARTLLETRDPSFSPPLTVAELHAVSQSKVAELQRMTDVGILISLVIAGCSLAVAVAGGFVERKRPFGLLRLAGMPLANLRRVVLLEAAVPLVLVVVVSVAAGLLAASLILDAALTLKVGLAMPSWSYCGVMSAACWPHWLWWP